MATTSSSPVAQHASTTHLELQPIKYRILEYAPNFNATLSRTQAKLETMKDFKRIGRANLAVTCPSKIASKVAFLSKTKKNMTVKDRPKKALVTKRDQIFGADFQGFHYDIHETGSAFSSNKTDFDNAIESAIGEIAEQLDGSRRDYMATRTLTYNMQGNPRAGTLEVDWMQAEEFHVPSTALILGHGQGVVQADEVEDDGIDRWASATLTLNIVQGDIALGILSFNLTD